MIDVVALRARIRRLEELARGLGIDEECFRVTPSPLMFDERDKYREALRQAIAGCESARVILCLVCQRIDGGPQSLPPDAFNRRYRQDFNNGPKDDQPSPS